ncbi:MAG: hypothetical protein ACI9CF_001064 [Candidatus Omnitrophota bacterium]|jgi:hypothetical protein
MYGGNPHKVERLSADQSTTASYHFQTSHTPLHINNLHVSSYILVTEKTADLPPDRHQCSHQITTFCYRKALISVFEILLHQRYDCTHQSIIRYLLENHLNFD